MWNTVYYDQGEAILEQGEATGKIYAIVEGRVELRSENGKRRELMAGDMFGEISLAQKDSTTTSAQAKSRVHMKEIERERLLDAINHDHELANKVIKTVFDHSMSMERKRMEEEASSTLTRIRQITSTYTQHSHVVLRGVSTLAKEALDYRELPINRFPFHFCRSPDNPGPLAYMDNYLLLNDDAPYEVSQKHCQLIEKNGKLILSDTTSRFGTLIDDVCIGRKHSQQSQELTPGTHRIGLGPSSHCLYYFEIKVEEC
ncbi:MAG TPA: cyclic nucleotide-binding domain-containing protein [Mariprofundaceae bacterium]|nr:cyclic nucleotide-binding domain-containing protein [Mariprofundaceae bacterium]